MNNTDTDEKEFRLAVKASTPVMYVAGVHGVIYLSYVTDPKHAIRFDNTSMPPHKWKKTLESVGEVALEVVGIKSPKEE
jgi:hypothetical protein